MDGANREMRVSRSRERASGTWRSLFALDVVAMVLVVIGAIALGLMGLFAWNPIHAIFGAVPWLERLAYIAIGAGGVYTAIVTPVLMRLRRPGRLPSTTSTGL